MAYIHFDRLLDKNDYKRWLPAQLTNLIALYGIAIDSLTYNCLLSKTLHL